MTKKKKTKSSTKKTAKAGPIPQTKSEDISAQAVTSISSQRWYGKEATVDVTGALTTVDGSDTLKSLVEANTGTDYSGALTDITLGGGEAGVDVLNVFGSQLKEESRPDLRTVDFTAMFNDTSFINELYNNTVAGTTGYTRVQGTDKTGSKTDKAILFHVTDGTNNSAILMNNAWFTGPGEVSLAADGRAEITLSATCLTSDYYVESDL